MKQLTKEGIVRPEKLALVAVCAGMNLGVGFVVASLKLPFYLDSIGTVLSTAIGGPIVGMMTGVVTVLLGSIYTPTLWAYTLTAMTIVLYTHFALKFGFLRRPFPTVLLGLGLGIATAIVSAPVTTYLWGGVSFSGTDAVTAFFVALGKTLLQSVLIGGLSTDPLDKLFTALIAYAILKRVPIGDLSSSGDLLNSAEQQHGTEGKE